MPQDAMLMVLIADDQPQVCSALRLVLRQEPDIAAVDEAGSFEQVLGMVRRQPPNLVLLDWELPDRGGAAVLARLRAAAPNSAVIALSGRPEAHDAALAAGADAFVSKGDPPELLRAAVAVCRTRLAAMAAP